jgi:dTDP-4-amino-4,6-dideoxygalactose transaminase
MDGIQGAVLGVKLRHLDTWNAARRQVAVRYQALLSDTALVLPGEAEGCRSVWHLYVICHPERDLLQQALTEVSIGSGLHYPIPVHLQPAYAHLRYHVGDFPVAERVAQECLSLPMYAELSQEQQLYIAQALKQALEE